jgi:hypothetical protein
MLRTGRGGGAMIGTLSPDEIEAMLSRQRVGRIGCSANDRPYVVPINYIYADGHVYAYSTLGRKIHTMREQPLICFEVDEIDGPSSWRSVVAEGIFEELTNENERGRAVERLAGIGRGLVSPGLTDRGLQGLIIFRLRLTEKSGRFERRDA